MDSIKVYVIDKGRRNLYLLYRDPETGKDVTVSAGTPKKREAEKAAAVWESALQAGKWKRSPRCSWEDFKEQYADEKLATMRESSRAKTQTAFRSLESVFTPTKLVYLTSQRIAEWQRALRKAGRPESTIKGYTASIKAALRWAQSEGMLIEVPKITIPSVPRADLMKGRPLTTEEFAKILRSVESCVGERGRGWRDLLRGLWLSGLRLSEALALDWTEGGFRIEWGRDSRPMFRIEATSEKGRRNRLLPVSPEFAAILHTMKDRTGPVFNPVNRFGKRPTVPVASRQILDFAKAAKVFTDPGKPACAHDLRRSFGTRWAQRVMPAVLQAMMRHSSIETTMSYYVAIQADDLGDTIYGAVPK